MKPRRILVLSLVALALAAIGFVLWRKATAPPATSMMSARAARADIEDTVLATGTLKPVRLVAVGAQVSGRITSVKVKLGETVKAGALVAEIDSITQENNLRTAEAALANVNAQLAEKKATLSLNKLNLDRQKKMLPSRAISQAEYDSAQSALDVTEAQIQALEAQINEAQVGVETAQANLGYTKITAPIDGTVLSIVSQEGQTVNAAQSAPTIVILGQLDTMTVRAEISEADITKVKPGLPLYFTVLGDPERRYAATLQSIEPAPESIRSDSSFTSTTSSATSTSSSSSSAVYYNGVFDVPNPDGRLRTYMTAEVHIILNHAENVLTIPATALGATDKDGRYAVRVIGAEDKLETRYVEAGINNKVMVEVRSGLKEGDRVVTGEMTAKAASSSPMRPPPPMGL